VSTIGLIVHSERHEAKETATDLVEWLSNAGHSLRLPPDDAELLGLPAHPEDETFADGLDLMVSLGGDGSVLRAVDLVSDKKVPVLGVNFGRLGYLTEVEPGGAEQAVSRCLAGDHTIEERMQVAAQIVRADGTLGEHGTALNEAVVEHVESGRTIDLAVTIDGDFFTSYTADGLIVASPTGSTAYSLSARGPIVAPTYEALIVTPVSPHMLFDRSLVLAPTSEVRIDMVADRPGVVALDGRPLAELQPGDAVICTRSAVTARFVVFGPRDFLGVLKAKFGLDRISD